MGCHIVKQITGFDSNMNNKEMPDTQPQTQSQTCWTGESQPIENVVWGRLYAKNAKLKSLGIRKHTKIFLENSSRSFGIQKRFLFINNYYYFRIAYQSLDAIQ